MPKDKDDDRKDHERTVQSVVYYRTDAFVSWLLKDVWALPESSCFYAFYVVCIPLFVLFLTTVTVFPALVFALHTQPVASALCSWVIVFGPAYAFGLAELSTNAIVCSLLYFCLCPFGGIIWAYFECTAHAQATQRKASDLRAIWVGVVVQLVRVLGLHAFLMLLDALPATPLSVRQTLSDLISIAGQALPFREYPSGFSGTRMSKLSYWLHYRALQMAGFSVYCVPGLVAPLWASLILASGTPVCQPATRPEGKGGSALGGGLSGTALVVMATGHTFRSLLQFELLCYAHLFLMVVGPLLSACNALALLEAASGFAVTLSPLPLLTVVSVCLWAALLDLHAVRALFFEEVLSPSLAQRRDAGLKRADKTRRWWTLEGAVAAVWLLSFGAAMAARDREAFRDCGASRVVMARGPPAEGEAVRAWDVVAGTPAGVVAVTANSSGIHLCRVGAEAVECVSHVRPLASRSRETVRALAPDGALALSSVREYARSSLKAATSVRLWDLRKGTPLWTEATEARTVAAAFSRDGAFAVSGARDGTVWVWNASTGAARPLKGHAKRVAAVAVSPDGALALSGSMDRTVRLWDVRTGRSAAWRAEDMPVTAVAFAADGRTALSGSDHGPILVWNISTGHVLARLPGYVARVHSVAFAAAGGVALSGSADTALRLWNVSAGASVAWLGHDGPVTSVAFATDGLSAVSSAQDGTLRRWSVGASGRCGGQTEGVGAVDLDRLTLGDLSERLGLTGPIGHGCRTRWCLG